MITNKIAKVKWSKRNWKFYKKKGYKFTNFNDFFQAKVKDLSKGSTTKVLCRCDVCGKFFMREYRHIKRAKKTMVCSNKCMSKLMKNK